MTEQGSTHSTSEHHTTMMVCRIPIGDGLEFVCTSPDGTRCYTVTNAIIPLAYLNQMVESSSCQAQRADGTCPKL